MEKNSIDNAIEGLNPGDTVRVKWKPFIRLYGRDEFIAEYKGNNPQEQTVHVEREWLDIFDMKFLANRHMPYDRIEKIELLEPKILYE